MLHVALWAKLGRGHEGRVLQFFRRWGYNVPCPPTLFFLSFVFGEISKTKVMFVTFCVKGFSC